MKIKTIKVLSLVAGVVLLSACGDDVTNVTNETVGIEVATSVESFGTCDEACVGKMMFASDENAVYICTNSGWVSFAVNGKGSTVCEDCGKFTDARDGKTYKTVQIGSQVWMAENLNYVYPKLTSSEGSESTKSDSISFCYGNDSANCETFGRLYTWAAAMEACPEGWHLPDSTESNTLHDYVAANILGGRDYVGYALKSTSGWYVGNGSDVFCFGALPAGFRFSSGTFSGVLSYAEFWNSTENNATTSSAFGWFVSEDTGWGSLSNEKSDARSVRCVKD